MTNEDLTYIELAKDFKKALEASTSNLKLCNLPNERLCKHEARYKDHIKIDWINSTSKNIKFIK